MEVFLIAAVTLDGYIGRSATDRSFDWTTPEDKKEYVAKIKLAQHLVIGNTTLRTFKKFPPGTICHIYTKNPESFSSEGLSLAASYFPTNESPRDLVNRLEQAGVKQLAICGGASIYQMFLAAGVVQKLYLTIEPIMFGQGVKLFSNLPISQKLQLTASRRLNDQGSMWLEYDVLN
jgi:dihydrofolate reductase